MTTIVCKTLGEGTFVVPYESGDSILQFCEKMHKTRNLDTYNKTCHYVIVQDGKIINQADHRHRTLIDAADVTKPVFLTFSMLAPPSMKAIVKGNMDVSGFEPDLKDCAICQEPFQTDLGAFKGTFISLDCLHRFHLKCIGLQIKAECPICRAEIPPMGMHLYREYARNL
jgi:hypothetical protein